MMKKRYYLVVDCNDQSFYDLSDVALSAAVRLGYNQDMRASAWGHTEVMAYESFEDLQQDWREGVGSFGHDDEGA